MKIRKLTYITVIVLLTTLTACSGGDGGGPNGGNGGGAGGGDGGAGSSTCIGCNAAGVESPAGENTADDTFSAMGMNLQTFDPDAPVLTNLLAINASMRHQWTEGHSLTLLYYNDTPVFFGDTLHMEPGDQLAMKAVYQGQRPPGTVQEMTVLAHIENGQVRAWNIGSVVPVGGESWSTEDVTADEVGQNNLIEFGTVIVFLDEDNNMIVSGFSGSLYAYY